MKKKFNKFNKIILSSIIIICIIGALAYLALAPYFRPIYSGSIFNETKISPEEEILFSFVKNRLTEKNGGVHTNYIDSQSQGDITKGHTVLSESQGLMLLYDLQKNNKEGFDYTLKYIKENMMLDTKLLSWRIENENKSNTSATIDDLRVVKALLIASEKWNDISYRKSALSISKGIRKNLVDKNILIDFNDGTQKSHTTTLCYLDLPTLKMLANIDYVSWKKIYDKSLNIINQGYINEDIPLYAKNFDVVEESYNNDDIDTLLSMIVILNKAAVGDDVSESIEWIKNEFDKRGEIVASYSKTDGTPKSDIQSTSIYSLIVQIAAEVNDVELEKIAMQKVKDFQIKNLESEVYGGYGSEDGKDVYSYDNLNALLAYRNFRE